MTSGDTLSVRPLGEYVPPIDLGPGQSYIVDPEAPLVEHGDFFGSPLLLRINAGKASFAIIGTSAISERVGADYLLVQELGDGQYGQYVQNIPHNKPVRVGHRNNQGLFQLDKDIREEHFAICRDENGFRVSSLASSLSLKAPVRNGRQVGEVIDTAPDFPEAHFDPSEFQNRHRLAGPARPNLRPIGRPGEQLSIDALHLVKLTQRLLKLGGRAVDAMLGNIKESPKTGFTLIEADLSKFLLENAYIHGSEYFGRELTTQLLAELYLEPKYFVKLDGADIYFSDTYKFEEDRPAVVGYVHTPDGRIAVRTYYLSRSQNLWRYLPSYIDTPEDRWFDKGHSQDSLNLPIEAQVALGELSYTEPKQLRDSRLVFFGSARNLTDKSREGLTYANEVRSVPIRLAGDFYASEPGQVVPPEQIDFYDDGHAQAPDFARPIRRWFQKSQKYGNALMEAFASNDGQSRITMGSDRDGLSWVAGIENLSPVMSTGLRISWVLGGDLLMPLREYENDSGGYGVTCDDESYVDMWPNYLSRAPLIRRYTNRPGAIRPPL